MFVCSNKSTRTERKSLTIVNGDRNSEVFFVNFKNICYVRVIIQYG